MSDLFTPLRIRGKSFSNRIAVSPMAQYKGDDGALSNWHSQHLGAFAVSNPGLVIVESTSVEREGWGTATCAALHTDQQEAALGNLLNEIRSYSDTPFGIQFGHSGRKGSTFMPREGGGPMLPDQGGWEVWGPSAIAYGPGHPTPRELGSDGLERVRAAYAQAAQRVTRLPIDLVELHGAHGYLLHTFLSPLSNQRTDAYGGTLERRTAFVAEIVQSLRAILGSDRVLGIRLNAEDYCAGGLTLTDTIRIVAILREAGLDYVCISAGAISSDARISASPGYLVPTAGRVRRETGITTFVTGMIFDPLLAEQAIADGHADMLAIGRAFLDNPRWPWHAAQSLGASVEMLPQFDQIRAGRWRAAAALHPQLSKSLEA
ncbi:oxidoreductase [Hoeflea alexandrii]|uniref:oxidoreductase n=1 Tax=Hoeflea alexandrii TaxID=288436 RepID=UPI0022AEA96D|nr:oxidoreductase [Hoeflea alexandrii]MCZ4291015.1 oxidoreductase [Hoeflea alexandrii]